jgi:hypothetical protein
MCADSHADESLSDLLGIGIGIAPMSCAIAPHPARAELLKFHTLEAVMSMPDELFYPVGVITCVMVFTAHTAGNLNGNSSSWKAFRIGDLFDVKKGKRLTKANMTSGTTPFIGAIDNNNGVTGFVSQPPLHPGGTITVNYNGAGVAEAFYQPVPYRCSDDVNVLYPKFDLTPKAALFIATVIKLEKYRFSYGRKWHLERMLKSEIRLPAKGGKVNVAAMEAYVDTLPLGSQI